MTALVQGGTKMVFFESRFLCMKKMGQGHKRTSSRRGVIIAGTVLGILLILVSGCADVASKSEGTIRQQNDSLVAEDKNAEENIASRVVEDVKLFSTSTYPYSNGEFEILASYNSEGTGLPNYGVLFEELMVDPNFEFLGKDNKFGGIAYQVEVRGRWLDQTGEQLFVSGQIGALDITIRFEVLYDQANSLENVEISRMIVDGAECMVYQGDDAEDQIDITRMFLSFYSYYFYMEYDMPYDVYSYLFDSYYEKFTH